MSSKGEGPPRSRLDMRVRYRTIRQRATVNWLELSQEVSGVRADN